MRPNTTQRNHWTQLGVGACALLVPPLTLGAALYSMLANPDEGTARPAVAAAAAQAGEPEPLRGAIQPWAASADPQPVTQATQPVPDNPARANPAPPANIDGLSPGSTDAEPSQSAPAEVTTALLPRVFNPPSQAPPQTPPPRVAATQMPAAQPPLTADLRSAEGPPTGKPARSSNPANRNETNPVNRSEAAAARRNAQLQRQNAFSLKNWLQQLGILPRNTRG